MPTARSAHFSSKSFVEADARHENGNRRSANMLRIELQHSRKYVLPVTVMHMSRWQRQGRLRVLAQSLSHCSARSGSNSHFADRVRYASRAAALHPPGETPAPLPFVTKKGGFGRSPPKRVWAAAQSRSECIRSKCELLAFWADWGRRSQQLASAMCDRTSSVCHQGVVLRDFMSARSTNRLAPIRMH